MAAATCRCGGGEALLEIRDLRVAFHTPEVVIRAVNGVDLDVRQGEVLAIVGESGSGKSVSMLSVMGLLPPRTVSLAGSIRFEGRELTALGRRELNAVRGEEIAMVFQDPMSSLNPVHPVGKQVSEALRIHRDIGRKEAAARAVELLGRVGIPDPAQGAGTYPHELSGGMRQRVMIAIALACDPKLLIADEPTTALDVTVQSQILELVRDLQAELGMAVVWITHDLGVVAQIADRVAVMYAGRVLETGSARDLYGRSRHPYTAGLLRSIPRIDAPLERLLPEIPGAPRTVTAQLGACPFHERCPIGDQACTQGVPDLVPTGAPGQLTACVHAAGLALLGPANTRRCEESSGTEQGPTERPPGSRAAMGQAPQAPGGRSPRLGGGRSIAWAPTMAGALGRARAGDGGDVVVSIRGLRVHFPAGGRAGGRRRVVRAVDGVDLDLRRGRTLGLVGESGCGKTTLGRCLVGLVEPTAGTVELEGVAVTARAGPRRRRIQMIFQDPFSSMNPGLTVGEVVAEPMRAHRMGDRAAIAERVADLLAQVGMGREAAVRHPHEFSGGQRQRIAVARALAAAPEVVVCDEAVSALDVSAQAQIVNLLRTLQEDQGLAYLFIAHDLAVVRHICDDVAVMYLGQIVERAPRDQLYANPLHPYTQALLAAVPSADPGRAGPPRAPVAGEPPSPADPPRGCRFHTRCPLAVPGLCDLRTPGLQSVQGDHLVACHLVPGDPLLGALEIETPAAAGMHQPAPT